MKNRAQNGGDLTLYHSTTVGNGEGLKHSALEQIGHTYGRAWYPTLTDSMKGAIYWTKNYTVPMVVVEYALPPAAQKKYLLPSTLDVKTHPIETYGTMYALKEPLPSKYFVKLHPVKKIAPRKSKWIVLKKTIEEKESVKFSDEWYKVLGYVGSDSVAESIKNDRQSKLERIYVIMLSYLRERFGDVIANKVSKKANAAGEYDPGKQNQAMYPVMARVPELESLIRGNNALIAAYNDHVMVREERGLGFFEDKTLDTKKLKRLSVRDRDPVDKALWGAAIADFDDGKLIAYHVADNPEKIMKTLKEKRSFTKATGDWEDLGRGFYASGNPWFWKGRSTKRTEILKGLTRKQREAVREYITKERISGRPGYLSTSEKEALKRDLDDFVETGQAGYLSYALNQPVNVSLEEMLETLGIKPYDPYVVVLRLKGRFFDIYSPSEFLEDLSYLWVKKHYPGRGGRWHDKSDFYYFLKDFQFDGMFQRGYFYNPQIVIWSWKAVVDFNLVKLSDLKSNYAR